MEVVYIICMLSILLLSIYKEKNMYNPSFVFSGVWLFIGILIMINLYDFIEISFRTYALVCAGVIFFSLGCFTRNHIKMKTPLIRGIKAGNNSTIRYRFLIPFYTFIVLFTILLFLRAFALLRRGVSMETIRFSYSSIEKGLIVNSAFTYDVEHYIVATAEFAAVALLPIIVMDMKSAAKYTMICLIVLFLIMHIFVTGARSFLINVIIVFTFYILISAGMKKRFAAFFGRIPKYVYILISAGALIIIVFMTMLRRGEKYDLLHEIYSYFAISFPLFDTHLALSDAGQPFTYGATALNGLLRPFMLLLKVVFKYTPDWYQLSTDLITLNNNFYAVGSGSANSFVTIFYYFYMDFGTIGVLLGSFLFGYLSQTLYKAVKKYPHTQIQAIYLLWMIGIAMSFTRLHLSATRYIYAFIIILMSFSYRGKAKSRL